MRRWLVNRPRAAAAGNCAGPADLLLRALPGECLHVVPLLPGRRSAREHAGRQPAADSSARGAAQQIGGVCCRVASERGINLCMIEHGDRWVCLIGSLPVERLAQMAGAVRW